MSYRKLLSDRESDSTDREPNRARSLADSRLFGMVERGRE